MNLIDHTEIKEGSYYLIYWANIGYKCVFTLQVIEYMGTYRNIYQTIEDLRSDAHGGTVRIMNKLPDIHSWNLFNDTDVPDVHAVYELTDEEFNKHVLMEVI